MYPFEFTEKTHLDMPLEENVNRIVLEEGTVEARNIEDAIAVLRYPNCFTDINMKKSTFVRNAIHRWLCS